MYAQTWLDLHRAAVNVDSMRVNVYTQRSPVHVQMCIEKSPVQGGEDS